MTGRPSVWLVSPAWRRFAVTRLVLEQRRHLIGELAARGIDATMLIVADDENLDLAAEYGSETLEWPNQPLAAKCNAGLRHACMAGADWVVWIGSDDWVHHDLVERVADHPIGQTKRTKPIITGRQIAFVNLLTGRMQWHIARGQNGVIPWIVPRELLEPCGFMPLRPDKRRGLDGALVAGMRRRRIKPVWEFFDPHDMARVDFKSHVNITSYQGLSYLARVPDTEPWEKLAERYPDWLVAKARQTHEDLKEA